MKEKNTSGAKSSRFVSFFKWILFNFFNEKQAAATTTLKDNKSKDVENAMSLYLAEKQLHELTETNRLTIVSHRIAEKSKAMLINLLVINILIFVSMLLVFFETKRAADTQTEASQNGYNAITGQRRYIDSFLTVQKKITDSADYVNQQNNLLLMQSLKTNDSLSRSTIQQQINALNKLTKHLNEENQALLKNNK